MLLCICKFLCLLQNRLGALRSFAHLRQLQLCQVYADDALTRLLQGLTDLQVRVSLYFVRGQHVCTIILAITFTAQCSMQSQ